jgi:hypothetical protein
VILRSLLSLLRLSELVDAVNAIGLPLDTFDLRPVLSIAKLNKPGDEQASTYILLVSGSLTMLQGKAKTKPQK